MPVLSPPRLINAFIQEILVVSWVNDMEGELFLSRWSVWRITAQAQSRLRLKGLISVNTSYFASPYRGQYSWVMNNWNPLHFLEEENGLSISDFSFFFFHWWPFKNESFLVLKVYLSNIVINLLKNLLIQYIFNSQYKLLISMREQSLS